MSFFERKIPLPRTVQEFDDLVARIVKKYKLPDFNHAAAVISGTIRHIDNYTAVTTEKYLGHSVLKNIANQIAYHKSEKIKHESQVTQLFHMLESDPGNQQARDELEKAANEGSIFAKEAIEKLKPKTEESCQVTDSNVVQLQK